RWGVHYDLGDRVSVEVDHGVVLTHVVREVRIEATPRTGELVTAVVGNPETSNDPAWLRVVSDLARRLGRLEAIRWAISSRTPARGTTPARSPTGSTSCWPRQPPRMACSARRVTPRSCTPTGRAA